MSSTRLLHTDLHKTGSMQAVMWPSCSCLVVSTAQTVCASKLRCGKVPMWHMVVCVTFNLFPELTEVTVLHSG